MKETKNEEMIFLEIINDLVENYGTGSQEGVKASLTECQRIFDCVSINHQQKIAELFQLDQKVISAMIRFMPAIKESIVEYEVVCCSGSRCAKNGSIEVFKAVKETLGIDFNETTQDGRIRLSTQNCFKKCNMGPNIKVNDEFHHRMDKLKTIELIKKLK